MMNIIDIFTQVIFGDLTPGINHAFLGGLFSGIGGLLGGIAGFKKKTSTQKNTAGVNLNPMLQGGFEELLFGQQRAGYTQQQREQISNINDQLNELRNLGGRNKDIAYLERRLKQISDNPEGEITEGGLANEQFGDIANILSGGPGAEDYSRGIQSQRDLASLLGEYSRSGGMPSQQDIGLANNAAQNLFAARQTSLNQLFQDQNTEAERLAARLGRPVNDPILQNKLRTGFIRQQDLLNAEQQGVAQNLALQLPGQRVGYAQSQAGLLEALGQRAVENRNFLLGLGSNLAGSERDFRLRTSQTYNNSTQSSGGGIGGAISGAIGGIGAGLGAYGAYESGQASLGLMNAQTKYINSLPRPAPLSAPMMNPGFNPNQGYGLSWNNPFAQPQTQFGFNK